MALTRKEILAIMKNEEYPRNLLSVMQGELDRRVVTVDVDNLTEDRLQGLEYALSFLDERAQLILQMRYRENKSTAEISEVIGVKSAGTLANSALFQLTKPPMLGYIVYGKQTFTDMLTKYSADISEEHLNTAIEDLNMSGFAVMELARNGFRALRDILYPTEAAIVKIAVRISPANAEMIDSGLSKMGIEHPLWGLCRKKEITYGKQD